MKKTNLLIVLILLSGNFLFAQTWDILDKSMAELGTDWSVYQGSSANGVVTQQNGYVNFTKTNTGQSGYWSWLRPVAALPDLEDGLFYSIEVKARVKSTGITDTGTNFESNQIALRLANKATTPVFLKYGNAENGSISTISNHSNGYKINTSEWQVYRIVLRADLKYDVYVDGVEEPIFEGQQGGINSDQNGIYFGAESPHRCNIDIGYVKVGTGDFYSKPGIFSVTLSRDNHISGNESTISVSAITTSFDDGEKLLFSFVDESDNLIVGPIEAIVTNNIAYTNIVIPAGTAIGRYMVKVEAANQVKGIDVAPKTVPYEIKDPLSVQTWDILDRDFSLTAWDADPAWALEKGENVPAGFVTQKNGYVNINKTQVVGSNSYGFLISPAVTVSANTAYTYEIKARAQAIDKEQFPDGNGGNEANQIGFILNNKLMSVYLIYGDENTGYLSSSIADGTGVSPGSTSKHMLNTSEWHIYRMVFNADNTKYDIYVDDELIFEDAPLFNKSGNNNAKIGGESWQRCNMDIEYARLGTGDLATGDKPKITAMDLSSDSHVVDNERTIRITANTVNILNGEKLTAAFTDEEGNELIDPIEILINAGKGVADLTIPATVPPGKYIITVGVPDNKIGEEIVKPKSMQYVVVDVSRSILKCSRR